MAEWSIPKRNYSVGEHTFLSKSAVSGVTRIGFSIRREDWTDPNVKLSVHIDISADGDNWFVGGDIVMRGGDYTDPNSTLSMVSSWWTDLPFPVSHIRVVAIVTGGTLRIPVTVTAT